MLWEKLWSDEYVSAYQSMTRWVADHIPFPGAAAREAVDMLVHDNAMMTDRLRVAGDEVHLTDIRAPFLTVLANRDHIIKPDAAAPLIDLVGSPDKHQLRLDAGHIGPRRGTHGVPNNRPDDHRPPVALRRVEGRCQRAHTKATAGEESLMSVVQLDRELIPAFTRFLGDLPEGDLTFVKEPATDPASVRAWADPDAPGVRWLALDGDAVTGFLEVLPLVGWSDHVGEIRLVVHPTRRGEGLGRELARRALLHAAESGLSKLVVEIIAEQEAHLNIFISIGFTGEALLRDHIRDREGKLRDVIMLAHFLEATNNDMDTLGLPDELG